MLLTGRQFHQQTNDLFESQVRSCYEIQDKARLHEELPSHYKNIFEESFKNLYQKIIIILLVSCRWVKIRMNENS